MKKYKIIPPLIIFCFIFISINSCEKQKTGKTPSSPAPAPDPTPTSTPTAPSKYRLNCKYIPNVFNIATWEVHTTQCEEDPTCPINFTETGCSYQEFGCEDDIKSCGNSYCEDGETKANCPLDCDVQRVPYTAVNMTTVSVGSIDRTYWLYEPPCYDGLSAVPLVFGLHGGNGTGEAFERALNLNAKADSECFIAVYPNGAPTNSSGPPSQGTHGIKQYWNSGPRDSSDWWTDYTQFVDDVSFISYLITTITSAKNIDTSRIYATGFSNGGRMAHRLACELDDKIAAVAVFGGPLHVTPCSPTKNVSVLQIHGKEDLYNPYDGGASCTSDGDSNVPAISETINSWRQKNSCSSTYDKTTTGDLTCLNYHGCANSSEVIFCSVENGGHTIAGGYTYPIEKLIGMGRSTSDIVAADFIWNFLSSHTLQ